MTNDRRNSITLGETFRRALAYYDSIPESRLKADQLKLKRKLELITGRAPAVHSALASRIKIT